MNDWNKTTAWLIAAGAMIGLVVLTRPVSQQVALLSDQGQPIAPELTDPLAVRSLEVISFDEQSVKMRSFKVEFDGKQWTIPSASGYPADAQEGVSRAASAFSGLVKERVVSDDKNDHLRYGLIDPSDESAVGATGRGTRVTMRDASGKGLVDVIIGSNVNAADTNQTAANRRYIREAGKARVYVTTIEGAFSTKFVDWVETDLLQFRPETAKSLIIDRYRIDTKSGQLSDRSSITLTRARQPAASPGGEPGAWAPWTVAAEPGGGPKEGEIVAENRVQEAMTGLSVLKITGVSPKPTNLAKLLGNASEKVSLTLPDQLSLQSRGFYITEGSGLVSSEGNLSLTAEDGVKYSLWLGQLAADSDNAAAGGQVGGSEAEAAAKNKTDSRYVMVTTIFDPSLLPEPAKSAELLELEKAESVATEQAPLADDVKKKLEDARKQRQSELDAHKTKVDAARKRAEQLSKRFANWYYLVDLKSLDQIRPTRDQLITKAPPPAPPAGSPGTPGAPGLPGQPPVAQPMPPTPMVPGS